MRLNIVNINLARNMQLYTTSVERLRNYVSQLPITDDFVDFVLDPVFFSKTPPCYFFYPEIFAPAFAPLSAENLERFNIATFLYYKYLMIEDHYVDQTDNQTFRFELPDMQKTAWLIEESSKLLSALFPLDSEFWVFWNQRRQEYLASNSREKRADFTIDLTSYEALADGRAALGKAAIDGMWILNGKRQPAATHARLIASHTAFTIGWHLLDDIKDIKEDYRRGQNNYACSRLSAVLDARSIDIASLDAEKLEKYFYLFGVYEEISELAISYIRRADALLSDLTVPLWQKLISEEIRGVENAADRVNAYLGELLQKVREEAP